MQKLPQIADKSVLAAVQENIKEVSVLKARIKFRKYGIMRFIGHLDVMRFFQKAMRRANIPIAFMARSHSLLKNFFVTPISMKSHGNNSSSPRSRSL